MNRNSSNKTSTNNDLGHLSSGQGNHNILMLANPETKSPKGGNRNGRFSNTKLSRGLTDLSLQPQDFDNQKIEYLIEGFLVKGSLTLITAGAGVGKSSLSIGIIKKVLCEVDGCVYLDADMPTIEIGKRLQNADLKNCLGVELVYLHSSSFDVKIHEKNENWKVFLDKLRHEKSQGNSCLCIFDNLKDLAPSGVDLDRDIDVLSIMKQLKILRDMGHTVLLLHHIAKDGNKNNPYKNSGSILDSVDVAYYLQRKDDVFTLTQFKQRIETENIVVLEMDGSYNLDRQISNKEKKKINRIKLIYETIVDLSTKNGKVLQKDILAELRGPKSIDKKIVSELLKLGGDIFWDVKSGAGTSLIYSPNLEAQNSGNLESYIRENIGFSESIEDDNNSLLKEHPDGSIELPYYPENPEC